VASEAFLAMLIASAISSMTGYFLTILCGRYASEYISRIDQRFLNRAVIIFLVAMVPISTGFWGIVILVIALMIGYVPVSNDMGKTVLCGCLILPSLLM